VLNPANIKAIMSTLDKSAMLVKLGAPTVSAKGAKQVPIFLENDQSLFLLHGPLGACFEPAAFNDPTATRVNLCLTIDEAVEKSLQDIDGQVVALMAADALKYFGQPLTEAQVLDRMQPSLRLSEKGFKSWRVKMNVSGRNVCRYFDMSKNASGPPETWVGCALTVRVAVRSCWLMAKEWGVLYEVQDIQIQERSMECPF
jgi:hypothetical protein